MSRARFALVFAVVFAGLLPDVASAQTTVQGQIIIQEAPPSTSVAPAPQAQVYAQPVMAPPPQMQCPVGSTMAVDAYGRPQCMMETTRHHVNGGLLGGGIGLLAGGYVFSIVTTLVESIALSFTCAFSSTGTCSAGDPSAVLGWGFVPLIGPLVQLGYFPSTTDTGLYAWHITESALQIGGLIMLIFGAIGEDVTEMTPVQGYALNVQPMITASTTGLAATLTF